MQYLSKVLLLLIAVSVSMSSCEKEGVQAASEISGCCADRKIVKAANDMEGHVWFNSAVQGYALYASEAGTYDVQYVGVPCELPEEFRKEGLQVIFSGAFKEYGKQPAGVVAGQMYYYLSLSEIREKP